MKNRLVKYGISYIELERRAKKKNQDKSNTLIFFSGFIFILYLILSAATVAT